MRIYDSVFHSMKSEKLTRINTQAVNKIHYRVWKKAAEIVFDRFTNKIRGKVYRKMIDETIAFRRWYKNTYYF